MARRPLKSILRRESWWRHYWGLIKTFWKVVRGPLLWGVLTGFLLGGFFAGSSKAPSTALWQCSLMFGVIFSAYGMALSQEFNTDRVRLIPPYKLPEGEVWVFYREGDRKGEGESRRQDLSRLRDLGYGKTVWVGGLLIPLSEAFLAGPQDLRALQEETEERGGPAKPIVTDLYERSPQDPGDPRRPDLRPTRPRYT